MPHYLARAADNFLGGWVKRFAPRLWAVDFPRPMMAAATSPEAGRLRVDLAFLTRGDLAGLIWSSEDRWSHPLQAYRTERDYRGVTLRFDWVAGPGVALLDAVHGPTLTIEGRDAEGQARTWYVRLWNYAEGTPADARITLDFSRLEGGFRLPEDADPVFAGDIDRIFLSLVPEQYDGTALPLAAPVETWVELRGLRADGRGSTIAIGNGLAPEHGLRMASGYDDSYHQTPERLVEQWVALGYRSVVNHYVGMSHYYALVPVGERFLVDRDRPLCGPATAWHLALARRLREAGLRLILSLSYELFAANAPEEWAQRTADGAQALTGWEPPSTLLSPCNADAMGWLQSVAAAFVGLLGAAGLPAHFQIGEPWWWIGPGHAPCFYDAATLGRYLADRGGPAPVITDVRGPRSAAEIGFLDWLGEQLAQSTSALVGAARAAAGGSLVSYLLFFAPQVLDRAAPELRRANMPAGWASPAFDVLQLEDYDFVTAGDEDGQRRGWTAVGQVLGYPEDRTQYFAGFVLRAADAGALWPRIMAAADDARSRTSGDRFLWAWPQIARDGLFTFDATREAEVDAFHDEDFPLAVGLEAVGGPEFRTEIAVMLSGHEQRNQGWADARMRYDAGIGVRSEADLAALIGFFRARRGQAIGFRFRDPMDDRTSAAGTDPGPFDQLLGTGDGLRARYQLVKHYGAAAHAQVRKLTRPVAASVRISVDGVEQTSGWALGDLGVIVFEEAPAVGAEVRAGCLFDVPVRFATDRLDISFGAFRSGEVPSVPLVEVRE
jgi:uncharacterized protein (TIGR02217 family)